MNAQQQIENISFDEFIARNRHRPATMAIIGEVVTVFTEALKQQQKDLADAKKEIEKLKARPLQKWAGVHICGVRYTEASLVTKGGSLWVSTAATTTTPGEAGSDWRLIVKRGTA
jgi:hypothetical protein